MKKGHISNNKEKAVWMFAACLLVFLSTGCHHWEKCCSTGFLTWPFLLFQDLFGWDLTVCLTVPWSTIRSVWLEVVSIHVNCFCFEPSHLLPDSFGLLQMSWRTFLFTSSSSHCHRPHVAGHQFFVPWQGWSPVSPQFLHCCGWTLLKLSVFF